MPAETRIYTIIRKSRAIRRGPASYGAGALSPHCCDRSRQAVAAGDDGHRACSAVRSRDAHWRVAAHVDVSAKEDARRRRGGNHATHECRGHSGVAERRQDRLGRRGVDRGEQAAGGLGIEGQREEVGAARRPRPRRRRNGRGCSPDRRSGCRGRGRARLAAGAAPRRRSRRPRHWRSPSRRRGPPDPKPVTSVQPCTAPGSPRRTSAATRFVPCIEVMAPASTSASVRPNFAAVAITPVPSALVRMRTSPARAPALVHTASGATSPVTAYPNFTSRSWTVCPPSSATPHSWSTDKPPAKIALTISGGEILGGKRGDRERRDRSSAHRVHVTHGIGRGNPAIRERVVDDGREEVDGLHQRHVADRRTHRHRPRSGSRPGHGDPRARADRSAPERARQRRACSLNRRRRRSRSVSSSVLTVRPRAFGPSGIVAGSSAVGSRALGRRASSVSAALGVRRSALSVKR